MRGPRQAAFCESEKGPDLNFRGELTEFMQVSEQEHVGTAEPDFAALLEESFSRDEPERGDILKGTILAIDNLGMIVDVGLGRDGVVDRRDLDRIAGGLDCQVGEPLDVMVIRSEDENGNLLLSASQARQSEDWQRAEQLKQGDEIYMGQVSEANRGGLIIPFGNLRGFIPASHTVGLARGLSEEERRDQLRAMIGNTIPVKVLEVDWKRRRLVFSQRDARRDQRESQKESLLASLNEGEVHKGVVSGLRDFGAFVDLGGADGLIHISELAWHRVRHPAEMLQVGQEVKVFILRLDEKGRRIGLSLKRLQQNPWERINEFYHVGQLVEGQVSRLTDFGAFIRMEPGIEALLHLSQIGDPPPDHPSLVVHEGQDLLMRVVNIEAERQRLGLSLKAVMPAELGAWEERRRIAAEAEAARRAAEAEAEAEADAEAMDEQELVAGVGVQA